MNLKYKIMTVLGLCGLLCISSYLIIAKMFDNIESQLYEKCRVEARVGAHVMGAFMDELLDARTLTEADLFDTTYVEIPGTAPKKYTTRYDKLLEKLIQKTLDQFLADPDLTYAVLVDVNGYAPTHNSKYSGLPTADPLQNIRMSRGKRIFDDPTGIRAARHNDEEPIRQLYYQDTGKVIWDIAASVTVKGRHWGAVRTGVSLERIDEIKNQMIILVGMSLLVILSITMLMLFLIIPRKLYDTDLNVPRY
ncbi:MAG: HAMP domain-containing protein [Spirochaetes bacterium]|nr:MAG: HAMP domain-containing protein [Spirochaetota bacterium]